MRYRGFEEIPIRVVVCVGRARLSFAELTELSPGVVLPLDRAVGTPFELMADEQVLGQVSPVASDDKVAVTLVSGEEEEDDVPSA